MKRFIMSLIVSALCAVALNAEDAVYQVYLYRIGSLSRGLSNATWGKPKEVQGTITFTDSEIIFSYPEEHHYVSENGTFNWRNDNNGWKTLSMRVHDNEINHDMMVVLRKNEKDQLVEVYLMRGDGFAHAYGLVTPEN